MGRTLRLALLRARGKLANSKRNVINSKPTWSKSKISTRRSAMSWSVPSMSSLDIRRSPCDSWLAPLPWEPVLFFFSRHLRLLLQFWRYFRGKITPHFPSSSSSASLTATCQSYSYNDVWQDDSRCCRSHQKRLARRRRRDFPKANRSLEEEEEYGFHGHKNETETMTSYHQRHFLQKLYR